MQKGFGEKAVDAVARDAGFQWMLGEFTIEQVRVAFKQYVSKNPDLPAPADIINIINPPPPKIDWALYIELKKRMRSMGVYVTQEEKQYVRDCEAVGIDRMRGEVEGYSNAQKELEVHSGSLLAMMIDHNP